MDIFYLFSSVTFLQFYIPLVIESKKRGFNNIFIFNNNVNVTKPYPNVYNEKNYNIIRPYIKKYNIKEINSSKINIKNIKGIVFMIDGDIYGPPRPTALKNSLLFQLNKKNTVKISFTEHMNFWTNYPYFINHIDHACFTSIYKVKQIEEFKKKEKLKDFFSHCKIQLDKSYENEKNIYLGNPKFENISEKAKIYKKFNLNEKDKQCLFLYPKMRNTFSDKDILNIYSHLKKLGFKIIIKTRPKDDHIPNHLRGDYFVCSEIYPNESLELMKVSDLCLISSSSANEETIFSEIPYLDLISDLRPWERNQYLFDDKIYRRVELKKWKKIKFNNFKEIYDSLEKKNSTYFKDKKEKFNLNVTNCSERVLDFCLDILNKK